MLTLPLGWSVQCWGAGLGRNIAVVAALSIGAIYLQSDIQEQAGACVAGTRRGEANTAGSPEGTVVDEAPARVQHELLLFQPEKEEVNGVEYELCCLQSVR